MARPSSHQRSTTGRPPVFWIGIATAVAVLVGALIAAGALTDENDSGGGAAAERGPVHVHGLGVNPGDGALYIATHTGMWRVSRGAVKPEPVGDSRQDTMGFTVAGRDHFLGSGHPDSFDQPPLLGLVESLDGGATWKAVSLAGEADFHVLRAVGKRLYGYDVTHERLMTSRDGGRTWTERRVNARVVDLVPDSQAPDRVLASTDAGLLTSTDAGATWNRVSRVIGLLGWPAANRLFLVGADGTVQLSMTRGRAWTRVGTIGGQPAAFFARTPRELYVAVHDGRILRSRDGGRSWQLFAT